VNIGNRQSGSVDAEFCTPSSFLSAPQEEEIQEMRVFDRVRLQDVDHRVLQLWGLAIFMILVLAGGLALHMYALASTRGFWLSERAAGEGIIAFCALAVLFACYLIDRVLVITHLRRELSEERKRNLELRAQSNKELLQTLFGPNQFCDRLALELQRASKTAQPLSGLTISLEVSQDISEGEDIFSAFGEAVKAMMIKLRGEDSIYQFSSGVFGLLLPSTASDLARSVAVRVADALYEAMGVSKRYSFDIRVTNFPDHARTADEMEKLMREPVDR
jgi:GGDEF domain-containing protein